MHRPLLATLLLCSAAAACTAAATEVYDTRTGEVPAWVRPKAPDAASLKADEQRREAQRLLWLEASPVGARDYCATSVIVSQKPAAPALQCFHGNTSAEELQAHGWELTEVRTSLHRHSPGFEVEVMNAIAIKRRCEPARASAGKAGAECEQASRAGQPRPNLFWMPAS